jgi:transcription-repair coupling factor (superfamily II helicase)
MLENKIEELKSDFHNIKNSFDEKSSSLKRISTLIDLNIEAFIASDFFSSELDKINFYREIESLRNLEDLDNLIDDFKEIQQNIPKETLNLFDLIKLKIVASSYKIKSIKKL